MFSPHCDQQRNQRASQSTVVPLCDLHLCQVAYLPVSTLLVVPACNHAQKQMYRRHQEQHLTFLSIPPHPVTTTMPDPPAIGCTNVSHHAASAAGACVPGSEPEARENVERWFNGIHLGLAGTISIFLFFLMFAWILCGFRFAPDITHVLINLDADIRDLKYYLCMRQRGLARQGLQKVPEPVINLIVGA